MRLSARTAWEAEDSAFAQQLEAAHAPGHSLLDLTQSNPTRCGLGYQSEALLAPLVDPAALLYEPDALGTLRAREAVAAYYADAGAHAAVDRICLTTSTSEGYSFLFRLLCDPGDEVLIALPSYPLFDSIARLDSVELRSYPLFYDGRASGVVVGSGSDQGESVGGWSIDLFALERSITPRTRAIVVVHPNNPTGNYASAVERAALNAICMRHDLALIVDEVFLGYSFDGKPRPSFLAEPGDALCFVLSGVSKVCGLPQMKASWLVAHGPEAGVRKAMERLEIIADTFLSMNAPVQYALPSWIAARQTFQHAVRTRVLENLAALHERLRGSQADRLTAEGGWTAMLRVPRFVDGVNFSEAALERGVIVQPGPLYGLSEARAILSLLTEPAVWKAGLSKLPF